MQAPQVIACALVLAVHPIVLRAQGSLRVTSELMIGMGYPGANASEFTPVYALGVEVTPPQSKLAFRLMAEGWEYRRNASPYGLAHESRGTGVALQGVRSLRRGRIQPYLLAGAGIFHRGAKGIAGRVVPTDSGIVVTDFAPYDDDSIVAALIWGVGTRLRISRLRLFAKARLPFYHTTGFHRGPQSPLIFGLRL